MPVVMTFRVKADQNKLEADAAADKDGMQSIVETAQRHGLIAHRFLGSENGEVMVLDVWPDEQSFHSFFAETGPQIQGMMQSAGVSSEPEVTFWRVLETHDKVGFDA